MIKKCWIDIQRRMKKTCEASQRSEKWRSIIYSTGYIGSKYLNITYSVKKCVIKIYITTPEIINFLCYYVYSYLFQWNDNVNINYPAEYEIGDIAFTDSRTGIHHLVLCRRTCKEPDSSAHYYGNCHSDQDNLFRFHSIFCFTYLYSAFSKEEGL